VEFPALPGFHVPSCHGVRTGSGVLQNILNAVWETEKKSKVKMVSTAASTDVPVFVPLYCHLQGLMSSVHRGIPIHSKASRQFCLTQVTLAVPRIIFKLLAK